MAARFFSSLTKQGNAYIGKGADITADSLQFQAKLIDHRLYKIESKLNELSKAIDDVKVSLGEASGERIEDLEMDLKNIKCIVDIHRHRNF
jgi:archaellum component FlaC